jgi:CheY-like chemotaxis protein
MKEKNFKILLVEDNKHDIELTLRAFQKNNLIDKVFIVKDGEEALNFIFGRGDYQDLNIEKGPKLILLDLKLPKVSGLEVLKQIKLNKRTKRIPVVILSSSREDSDIHNALDFGANSYIVKPLKFDKLVTAIRDINNYWFDLNENIISGPNN